MSRLLAFALSICVVSSVVAGPKIAVLTRTGNIPPKPIPSGAPYLSTSGAGFSDPSFQVFGLRAPSNRQYKTTSGAGFSDPSFQVFGLQAPTHRQYMTVSGPGFSEPSFQVFGLRAPSHQQYLTTSGPGFSDPSFQVFGLRSTSGSQYLTTSGPGFSDPSFQVFGLQAPTGLQYLTTSGAGFSDPSFQVFPANIPTGSCASMSGGLGFCGPCFGSHGFSCGPIQFGCVTPCNPLMCGSSLWPGFPTGCNFGYSYELCYGYPCELAWMPSWSRWGLGNYDGWPVNYIETISNGAGYQGHKPQVINFDKPLAPRSASIRIETPGRAKVFVQGQAVGPVFVAENLKGSTKIEFKVRRTVDGKVNEVTYPVSVVAGDRKQLVILP